MLKAALTVGVLFFATLTSSTFGFGGALFSMPLLTLVVGIDIAIPLFGLIGPMTALIVTGTSWRQARIALVWRMLLATLAGIPLGVALVNLLPQTYLVVGLGVFLIAFGIYRLLRIPFPQVNHPAWAYPFGLLAGVLGGAYNTSGPPVVIYANMNRWPPEIFRATLQSYFLPTGVGILVSHGLGGLWTPQVFYLFVLSIPAVMAAIWLGAIINHRFSPERFNQWVFIILIGLGVLLLAELLSRAGESAG